MLNECRSAATDCQDCIEGDAERCLQSARECVAKCENKVRDGLTELLGESMGWAAAGGMDRQGDAIVGAASMPTPGDGIISLPDWEPPSLPAPPAPGDDTPPNVPTPPTPPPPCDSPSAIDRDMNPACRSPGGEWRTCLPGELPPKLGRDNPPCPDDIENLTYCVMYNCFTRDARVVPIYFTESSGFWASRGYQSVFCGINNKWPLVIEYLEKNYENIVRDYPCPGDPQPPWPPVPPEPPKPPAKPPVKPPANCVTICEDSPPLKVKVEFAFGQTLKVDVGDCKPTEPQLPECTDDDVGQFWVADTGPDKPIKCPLSSKNGRWVVYYTCLLGAWKFVYVISDPLNDYTYSGWKILGRYDDEKTAAWVASHGSQWEAVLNEKHGQCGDKPPPPKPPPPPQPKPWQWPSLGNLDWNDPHVCESLANLSSQFDSEDRHILSKMLGLRDDQGGVRVPQWLGLKVNGVEIFSGSDLAEPVADAADSLWNMIRKMPALNGCQMQKIAVPVLIKAILGIIQKWTGADVDELKQPYDYWHAYQCPTDLPSPADTDSAYMAGTISAETWECWQRANGMLPAPAAKVLASKHPQPSPRDARQLLGMGLINPGRFDEIMRINGLIDAEARGDIVKAMESLPSPSDLVHYMTRDAADETGIDWSAADAEFKAKYTGPMLRWADAQGVSELSMRYAWRSHYSLPSPTQLYVMLHRLRPGRVPEALAVTAETVLSTLGQNDIAPQWRERLAAISYVPMTRVDIRRAFEIGSVDHDEAVARCEDIGYTKADAETLVKFWRRGKHRRAATERPVGAYTQGLITRAQAGEALKALGYDDADIGSAFVIADAKRKAARRKACQRAIRTRFFQGELARDQATAELIRDGSDTDQADDLVSQWACELKAAYKLPTVAQLAEFYEIDLISPEEYFRRLRNLGFAEEDALRVAKVAQEKKVGLPSDSFDKSDTKRRRDKPK